MTNNPNTSMRASENRVEIIMPKPVPDPGAEELLAPAAAPEPAQPPASTPSASCDEGQRDGTSPPFPLQPADTAVVANAPPFNAEEERAAWQSLIAFIQQHKDEGTTVEIADPDTFMQGLT